MAVNIVAFYVATQFVVSGFTAMFTKATNLLPVGFAVILTTVANGLLSAEMKERLVFLRWRHALPGHRAFSKYAYSDPRVDLTALRKLAGNKLPTDPDQQNRTWYRFYKEVENVPAVQQVHRDFLLMRDYAGLAVLFLLGFGGAAFLVVPSITVSLGYCIILLIQFAAVRRAAATYGIRFVSTVLAQKLRSRLDKPNRGSPSRR
jgi:hypothetical protein